MQPQCHCTALRSAARKLTALYDKALAPAGITVAQFSLLRAIERAAPLSLTALARAQALDRSTVGRNIRILQRLGLVEITQGRDQREATLSLEPSGRERLQQGAPLWEAAQARIEAILGRDGTSTLQHVLHALDGAEADA